ncbi:hypothetical protein DYB25_013754, partial [Aphanomyces astaci]
EHDNDRDEGSTNSSDNNAKRAKHPSLPFPSTLRVLLSMKLGEPLGKARSPLGQREFDCTVSEGFDVLRQKVAVYCRQIADDYNQGKVKGVKKEVDVRLDDNVAIYFKPGSNTSQVDYVLLTHSNHLIEMQETWRHGAQRSAGQASFKLHLFVYVSKDRPSSSESQKRMSSTRGIVRNRSQVSSTIERAADATSEVAVPAAPVANDDGEYRNVRFKLNGVVVQVPVNVADMKAVTWGWLSECTPSELRRAVHPITAIQMEWSLQSRYLEADATARELGVGIVAYSPMCRGFFGAIDAFDKLEDNDRTLQPRIVGPSKAKVARFFNLAKAKSVTPAQLTLG